MRWWGVWLLAAGLLAGAQAASVYDLISEDAELSEFLSLLNTDMLLSKIIQVTECTVFVPTNAALRRYTGERSVNVLQYHVVSLAMSLDRLTAERAVTTRLKGSQPVFVSEPQPGHVFINNARILRSDIRASSENQQEQVLHIIDEVLEPTVAAESVYFNPSALQFLTNSDQYDLGGDSIEKFYQKVEAEGKADIFNSGALHTYFIPIDEHFDRVRDRVKDEVIDGHVIPGHALFTRTMGTESYRTLAFNDMLKVTIKLHGNLPPPISNSSEPTDLAIPAPPENLQQADRLYEAQSTILLGNIVLQAGSVLSKVVKPNIAVKNGVVHLIKKPLMVTDGDVLQMIQEGQNDRFHEFHKLVQQRAGEFMVKLMTTSYFTIFIPSNEAFYKVDQRRLREVIDSPERLMELLKLHLVGNKVTTESVRKSASGQPYRVPSDSASRSLYLSVAGAGELERTLTVEGGGTNATVIVPDIGRSNGVIHIIDRFLGIPYQTVAERMATDPLARVTSSLAEESGFSQELKALDRMTLLLPADTAWQRLQAQLNTSYNAILANKRSPEVLAVLKHHLILGESLTIQEMANITRAEGGVITSTGQRVEVEHIPGSTEYLVKWQSLQARVVRTDEECTNGYIHAIDAVLVGPKDVSQPSTAAAASAAQSAEVSALLLTACWALLRL